MERTVKEELVERAQTCVSLLTFLQHAHFQTLHEAARLARLASPLGDLTLVGGRTAVLDVTWRNTAKEESVRTQIHKLNAHCIHQSHQKNTL